MKKEFAIYAQDFEDYIDNSHGTRYYFAGDEELDSQLYRDTDCVYRSWSDGEAYAKVIIDGESVKTAELVEMNDGTIGLEIIETDGYTRYFSARDCIGKQPAYCGYGRTTTKL